VTPIDYSFALRWVDGDRTLLAELAEMFLQDCPQRMKELEEGVKGSNAESIRQAAHSLKGMVSGFGAYQAKSLAAEMEKLGRGGQVTEAVILLPAVLCEFVHVIEHLKKTDWQIIS
jgi:HPt (histidine-containing phosphotransfer) domain-containing protein